MKIKTAKKSQAKKGQSPFADDFAKRYFEAKDSIADAESIIAVVREEVSSLASKCGVREGNTTLVRGKTFEVGITDTMSSPRLDVNSLRAELRKKDPRLAAKVFTETVTYVLVEDAFLKAVEDGKIPRTLVERYTTPSAKTGERIHVKKISAPSGI